MSLYTRSQSFVQRTFPPLIGSLTSSTVEDICQKNNVSFNELLAPFCTVYADYQLKDPSGNDLFIKHLKVGVNNVNEAPPEPRIARRLMDEAVAGAWCDVTKEVTIENSCGTTTVDIPAECPWFHSWAETFFRVQFPSEHEFIRHLLGCMIVTSTLDPPETLQSLLESLKQMQIPDQIKSQVPKWFCPAIFKFYVVIHDSKNGGRDNALKFFESIKTAYGSDHCFFLELNSKQQGENSVVDIWIENKPKEATVLSPIESPVHLAGQPTMLDAQVPDHPLSPLMDNHTSIAAYGESFGKNRKNGIDKSCGSCLSAKDVDSLRELMRCIVRNALLPHVEKQIYILSDLVANKKGMSRSLLNVTKRLFGSPRPSMGMGTGSGVSAPLPPPPPAFPPDAPELQLRRLADLYFMFSSYSNAFQTYYTAKRELGAEQAWLYYAGALEMAALSAFMLPDPVKKGIEYMEEAILTYLNSCQLRQFATRATLLSVECLKEREMFGEAAKQLIRMTSEDSDLRSALLLEQAAYCVLHDSKPRKYAFHLVLAGHRYSKAGQRKHAMRCVRQALQIYGGRAWGLAEDHIHSTIGRLAGQLYQQGGAGAGADPQLLEEGLRALTQLLHSRSRQGASQQATYLLEYLTMHQAWQTLGRIHKLAPLPLPEVEENTACVRVVVADQCFPRSDAFQLDSLDETLHWAKMEEIGLTETIGTPMVFRPTLPVLSKSTLNPHGLVMAVNERFEVQVALRNPLQISLPLAQLRLLWTWTDEVGNTFEGGDGFSDPNRETSIALTEHLPSLLLPPLATHFVTLSVSPRSPGTLNISSIACSLTTAVGADCEQSPPIVRGRQDLVVRGPKLRPPKDRPFADYYADDKRLSATVIAAAPNLTVSNIPSNMSMLCGQMEEIELKLKNSGNASLTFVHAVMDSVELITLPHQTVHKPKRADDAEFRSQIQVMSIDLSYCGGIIEPGAGLPLRVWVRGPDLPGTRHLRLLLFYGCEGIKHRVVRVTLRLVVSQGIQMSAVATRSCHGVEEATNLCVTASNTHSAPVTMCNLILASSSWALQPHALSIQDGVVQSSESSLFVCRARRQMANESSTVLSLVKLTNKQIDLSEAANNLLLNRSTQFIVLALVWETMVNERVTLGLSIVEIGRLGVMSNETAPLISPDVTDVVARTRTLVIFGPGRVAASTRSVPDTADPPIFISLAHPDKVIHSFKKDRVCLVDVRVSVCSRSDKQLRVTLNGGGSERSTILPSHVYSPHAASAFTWAARACANLRLAPRGQATTTLRAALTKPGTYDLALRLTAAAAVSDSDSASKTSVLVSPLPQSPLIVIDSDSHVS